MEPNGNSTKEPVRILCAANAAYAAPLCVMLVSLLANFSKSRKIEVYVLATNIPQADRQKIETSLRRIHPNLERVALHWLLPDMESLQGLHIDRWLEIETYARLLAPVVLPENADRVLYLDSDMVILGDVSVLYDSLHDGKAVHAARDQIDSVSKPSGVFNYTELGISPDAPYFNAGVLLINLQKWRQDNVANRILDYLRLHHDSVQYHDQGGLNAILHDSWTEIDPTWNQMHFVLDQQRWKEPGRSLEQWKRARNHPRIVHYTSDKKPWLGCLDPRYSYFFKYLDKTEYRGIFKGPRLERIIGFRLNYLFWRMKIILLWKRSPGDIFRVLKRGMFRKTNQAVGRSDV